MKAAEKYREDIFNQTDYTRILSLIFTDIITPAPFSIAPYPDFISFFQWSHVVYSAHGNELKYSIIHKMIENLMF